MATPLRLTHFLLILCLGAGSRASAQHMNAPDAPCQDTGGVVTTADNCFARAYKRADARMSRFYEQVRQVLTPEQQTQLMTMQRLWLQLRDATCHAESDLYKGGVLQSPVYTACLEEETRHHTADLRTTYGWVITNSK